jgi:anti-sigma factor RsiW
MQHLAESVLHDFHDRLLSERDQEEAGRHIGQCPACAGQLEAIRAVCRALDQLPVLVPSLCFADAVMARVRVVTPPLLARLPAPVLVAASVAAMLPGILVGLAVLWLSQLPGASAIPGLAVFWARQHATRLVGDALVVLEPSVTAWAMAMSPQLWLLAGVGGYCLAASSVAVLYRFVFRSTSALSPS